MKCTAVWIAKQLGLIFVELVLALPMILVVLWLVYDALSSTQAVTWDDVGLAAFIIIIGGAGSIFVVAISIQETVRWIVEMVKEMK